MEQSRTIYKNAPIAEALIDLQVIANEPVDLEECIKNFTTKLNGKFPEKKNIRTGEFKIEFPDDKEQNQPQVETSQKTLGVRFDNEQNNKVLQIRINGFTLSYINYYSNWEEFCQEARLYWKEYLEIFKPKTVSRVAVRYINKLEIPGPIIEPSEYFNLYPKVPEKLPQKINDFLLRMVMPQSDIDSIAIINQATMQASKANHVAVALDFDIFKQTSFEASSEEVWELLYVLRDRKNLLFESCITEKTREAIR
jgi:uncharacterized protein (TIGR04255 family)